MPIYKTNIIRYSWLMLVNVGYTSHCSTISHWLHGVFLVSPWSWPMRVCLRRGSPRLEKKTMKQECQVQYTVYVYHSSVQFHVKYIKMQCFTYVHGSFWSALSPYAWICSRLTGQKVFHTTVHNRKWCLLQNLRFKLQPFGWTQTKNNKQTM